MIRLAVLSDIHGNWEALQAVLADLEAIGGADKVWVLGDLAAFGPKPSECIQAVRQIPNVEVIEGNTDRYLRTGVRPQMPAPSAEYWDKLAEITRRRDAAFTWTLEQMAWEDMEFLTQLKHDLALEAEDFGWVIAFHAIPNDDEALTILPQTPDYLVRDALLDREGRLALCGHTHLAFDRDLGDWRVINPGSVGLPFDGDTRAAYALLSFEGDTVQVDLRRVEYDIEAVIRQLEAANHPMLQQSSKRLRTAQN